MAYFKINGVDYSTYVNKLTVDTEHIYQARTNASGNTLVKYVNTKKVVEVGIIPLDESTAASLQRAIDKFQVQISYRNPKTRALETINCIIPNNTVEYYTIRADKVMLKAFNLIFQEL